MHTIISQEELTAKSRSDIAELRAGDFSKYPFCYYTKPDTLEKILDSGCFWARSFDLMNDKDEAKLHEEERKMIHALCFCNTRTEGIPMWYLYSGSDGKGVCLRFTSSQMLAWMKKISFVYPVTDDKVIHKDTPLYTGKDVDIQFGWVLYHGHKGEYQLRNKWYLTDNREDLKDSFFIKKYPWNYEREFRIVIVNKTGKPYMAFAIPTADGLMKKAKLMTGPEMDGAGEEILKELSCKYYPNPLRSDLQIRMKL